MQSGAQENNCYINVRDRIEKDGLFAPNDAATYDFNSTDLPDNVRVPLVDDPRVLKALKLFSEKNALMNSVPGMNVNLPQDVARKVFKVELQAFALLAEASGSPVPGYGLALRSGAKAKKDRTQ